PPAPPPLLPAFPTRRYSDLESFSAANHVRDARLGQRLLVRLGLGVGPKQHGDLTGRGAARDEFSALLSDRGGLRHLVRVRPQLRSEEHTSELQSRENLVCRL